VSQISPLKYFLRRLRRRSVNGVPNISSKIFSQEASPIICDSLFELIPYISSKIFSQEASPIICDSLFELIPYISSKIFSQKASPNICKRRSKYFLDYFLKRLRRTSVNGVPNISWIIFSGGFADNL